MTEPNQYAKDLMKLIQTYPILPWVSVDVDGGPEAAIKAYNDNKPIPVFTGDSENTIWGHPRFNWLFRAYHDALHLRNNIPFTLEGEYLVAELHSMQAEKLGLYELARAMRIDITAFAVYMEANNEHAPQTITQDFIDKLTRMA